MSVSTVAPTNEFVFPIRPVSSASSSSNTNNDASRRGNPSHSRQYTGIELPWPIGKENLSHQPFSFDQNKATAPSNTLPPPKSPHRRHAHKRSGAVSAHDISGLDLDLPPPPSLGSPFSSVPKRSNSTKTTSKSSTTSDNPLTCSSSSSLPNTLDDSSPTSFSSSPSRPKVSFASSPATVINNDDTTASNNPEISVTPPDQITKGPRNNRSLSPPRNAVVNEKRHKKVKSWAGSLIKLRSSKESKPADEPTPTSGIFQSSSYVVPDPSKPVVDEMPAEPLIDLDAALSSSLDDMSKNSAHRRSESAPENGFRGVLRPKGSDSILEEEEEEEEEEEPPKHRNPLTSQSAASSSLSVNSTASSSVNRERGSRYTRNYNPNILSLDILKTQQQQQQQSDHHDDDDDDQEQEAYTNPRMTRHADDDDDKTNKRASTLTVSTGTITPGDIADGGPTSLGAPGPQVRSFSVSEGQLPQPSNTRRNKRNSFLLRSFHGPSSSCTYNDSWDNMSRQSKRRSLRIKLMGWLRGGPSSSNK